MLDLCTSSWCSWALEVWLLAFVILQQSRTKKTIVFFAVVYFLPHSFLIICIFETKGMWLFTKNILMSNLYWYMYHIFRVHWIYMIEIRTVSNLVCISMKKSLQIMVVCVDCICLIYIPLYNNMLHLIHCFRALHRQ